MRPKAKKIEGRMIVPLNVPEDMRKSVRMLAEKSGLSDADIMRLAIERGLAPVERMFDHPDKQAA